MANLKKLAMVWAWLAIGVALGAPGWRARREPQTRSTQEMQSVRIRGAMERTGLMAPTGRAGFLGRAMWRPLETS